MLLNKAQEGGRWVATLIDWEACAVLGIGADPALMLYYHFRKQMGQPLYSSQAWQTTWGFTTNEVLEEYMAGLRAAGVEVDGVQSGCLEMLRRLMQLEICSLFLGKLWLPTEGEDAGILCRGRWQLGQRIKSTLDWMHIVVEAFHQLPD